ncbi:hypothetical protein GCM10027447_36020 [Glycomyces halotolerans]
METFELDELSDAVVALAGARDRIPLDQLLRETALNILILARIASGRLRDPTRQEAIDAACGKLIDLLRQAARELPPPES